MNQSLISILSGLGGMFGWGTSDFFANIAAEKIDGQRTFFWSQIAGLLTVFTVALMAGASFSFSPQLLLGIFVSGVLYAVSYTLFYKGFQIGNVSVVSSVINLQNVFIIAVAYFVYQQRIHGLQIPGVLLVLLGITLVTLNIDELRAGKLSLAAGVKETLLAALGFGMFWPINQYVVQRASWLSTTVLTKFVALSVLLLFAVLQKKHKNLLLSKTEQKSWWKVLVATGVLEVLAVMSVSWGLSVGNAIIITPIASALTLVTVGLSVVLLKIKVTPWQVLGVLGTVVGIVLMAIA